MVFCCFFFGKFSGQQFFQLTTFPHFFVLMAKTCHHGEQQKHQSPPPQKTNWTFSFCKIAIVVASFHSNVAYVFFFGPGLQSPPVQRCGQRQGNHHYIAGTWRCKLQPNGRSESENTKNPWVGWLVVTLLVVFVGGLGVLEVRQLGILLKSSLFFVLKEGWIQPWNIFLGTNQLSKSKASNIQKQICDSWLVFEKSSYPSLKLTACLPLKIDAWKTKSCFPLLGCHIIKG